MALPREELDTTMKCIKYLLITFNFIFVLTGVLIISVGTTIHALYNDFEHFLEGNFFSPAILMIVIGSFIFAVALFGCVGAAKESTCMIMVFSVFLGIIFILEVSAGIAGYALQGSIRSTIGSNMLDALPKYENDRELQAAIDFTQKNLECCGVDGPQDWEGLIHKPSGFNGTLDNNTIILPSTCCGQITAHGNNTLSCDTDERNFEGCLPRLSFLIGSSTALLGGAAICVSIIQVIGIYFSITLGRAIRYAKTERERRRQEIREQLINSYSLLKVEEPVKVFPVVYMNGETPTDSTA